jgi:hypothetical protein
MLHATMKQVVMRYEHDSLRQRVGTLEAELRELRRERQAAPLVGNRDTAPQQEQASWLRRAEPESDCGVSVALPEEEEEQSQPHSALGLISYLWWGGPSEGVARDAAALDIRASPRAPPPTPLVVGARSGAAKAAEPNGDDGAVGSGATRRRGLRRLTGAAMRSTRAVQRSLSVETVAFNLEGDADVEAEVQASIWSAPLFIFGPAVRPATSVYLCLLFAINLGVQGVFAYIVFVAFREVGVLLCPASALPLRLPRPA